MLGNLLRKNEEKKKSDAEQKEAERAAAMLVRKQSDLKKVAAFFKEVRNYLEVNIKAGACITDLRLKLSYYSKQKCGTTNVSDVYKMLTHYSYAFRDLFEKDEEFSPIFKEFKAWCESEGLKVVWSYREEDRQKMRWSHDEDEDAGWSLEFTFV